MNGVSTMSRDAFLLTGKNNVRLKYAMLRR